MSSNKIFQFLIYLLFFISSSSLSQNSPINYIDPNIGSVSHLLQPCRPTVQLPNQMVRMHPIRKDYLDDQISWFPMSLKGHRGGGLFGIKPMNKEFNENIFEDRLTYDHDFEVIHPWYYSTYFINEEFFLDFVPGKKSGYFRVDYKNNQVKTLFLKIMGDGFWEIIDGNKISGVEYIGNSRAYVYIEFKNLPKDSQLNVNNKKKAWINLNDSSNDIFELKYGFSFISIEQAKENLFKEIPKWDFEALKKSALSDWEKVINQIKVEGGSETQKRTFYTSLYRTYERMIDINEYGHYFSGYDGKIHKSNRPFYVDDWIWDTYRAHHPLRAILTPEIEDDMLNSYVLMYEQSGWLPTFPGVTGNSMCMNSYHSSIMFIDGYRKGLRNYDIEKAYEGIKKNSIEGTYLPWRQGSPKVEIDDFYHERGFFPALHPGEKETIALANDFEKRQSVAVTLGHSYDDWAISELAKELGRNGESKFFKEKSNNYKNLWRSEKKLMWPKDSLGNWIDIDPKYDGGPGGRDYYDENNGWTYAWGVQHDIPGLISLMGGEKQFEENLDQLFREDLGMTKYHFWNKFPDATGLVGQFSMGNEPSFHIPYLYNYTTSPWKTQKRIRFLLDVWFKDNIFGIPGDEDGGGMTAFVVFSMMGFYPVTPGIPEYTIGSPVFEKVVIDLQNGSKFTIIAKGSNEKNKYVQSIKLNGKELNSLQFSHEKLMNGATLELEMGAYPNKELKF